MNKLTSILLSNYAQVCNFESIDMHDIVSNKNLSNQEILECFFLQAYYQNLKLSRFLWPSKSNEKIDPDIYCLYIIFLRMQRVHKNTFHIVLL